MMKKYLLNTISFLCCMQAIAQFRPAEGDSLHYRLVGFEVPPYEKATGYTLQVFTKTDTTTPELQKTATGNRIITIVPQFGKEYYWRVSYYKKNRLLDATALHHFYTRENPYSDTSVSKMKVLKNTGAHDDLLVLVDNTRTLYTQDGQALWFLPEIPGITDNNYKILDLKLTGRNTITFLSADKYACEIDYNGHMLWTAPNDGKVSGSDMEHYHHQLDRLKNGHYMVAGIAAHPRQLPDTIPPYIKADKKIYTVDSAHYIDTEAGTLIEYDSAGNVVWSWISGKYYSDADLFTPLADGSLFTDTHLNAFYFDEERHIIYTSFRDVSRIVKIAYPSGKVIAAYGNNYAPGSNLKGSGLFYGQHACRINSTGNLYLFNNNSSKRTYLGKTKLSSVVILKEPRDEKGQMEQIWEYGCDIDNQASHFAMQGGNAYELPNGDLLVCMGVAGRFFIVSPDKTLQWNVVMQLRNTRNKFISPSYRVSPVYKDQLEGLLFR